MPDSLIFPSISFHKQMKTQRKPVKNMTLQKMDTPKHLQKPQQPSPQKQQQQRKQQQKPPQQKQQVRSNLARQQLFRPRNDLGGAMIGRIANIRPGCSSCGGAR